jgi:hypothetical protein
MSEEETVSSAQSKSVPPPQTLPLTPQQKETISNEDKQILAFAKMKHQMTIKEAEKVLAQNEASEANFRCTLLQLYLKYNLNPDKDSMDENGNITRNVKKEQQ